MGYSGLAKWLNKNGYRKTVRQNGKHATFTESTLKAILENPVYRGKIVRGRFKAEKIRGSRNEYRRIQQDQYEEFDGQHEAIVSDELWEAVRARQKVMAGKPQQHYGPVHVYMLSGIVKCPVCGSPLEGNMSHARKRDGSFYPIVLYYSCRHGKHVTGRPCTYNRSIRTDVLDAQVIQVVQQAVNSMYVQKGLITSLCNPDDLAELTARLDGLRTARRGEEQKKTRLLGKIARLDADDDQYDSMYDDLQGVLRQHNKAIAELDDQIEDISAQLAAAKNGAASFQDTLRMFHRSMGSIESWTPEQKREFMHNFLEYIEIYPKALDNGRLVKRIRFKIPVSVDGGQTYRRTIDLDDDTPPDGGPQGGEGPLPPIAPHDDGDFQIGEILPSDGVDLQTADVLPNPDIGLLIPLPIIPPPMPPSTIRRSDPISNSGTLLVSSVKARADNWLNKMIYKLLAAAVLVSMEKK